MSKSLTWVILTFPLALQGEQVLHHLHINHGLITYIDSSQSPYIAFNVDHCMKLAIH